MVGSKLRKLFGLGTVCGVAAMLVLVTGCPFAPSGPCANNPCDDGLYCNGVETCTVDGDQAVCGDGVAVECEAGQICDEELDACRDMVDLCEGVECDDGDVCTDDSCDSATGDCVYPYNTATCDDADACTEDDVCADGACAGTAMDCDDEDACTTDACVDGACVYTDMECLEGETCVDGVCIDLECVDVVCDDEDLCTTDECVAGECVYTAVVCDEGYECDAETGDCVEVTEVVCETDEDCVDDGLFCNGIDVCDLTDPENGVCVAGDRPCSDTDADGNVITCDEGAVESCGEGDTEAVCTACPSETLDFTLASDNLVGTTGDDVFSAPLVFNAATGGQVASLQTGDKADGFAGADTMSVFFTDTAAAATATPTRISGIEVIDVTNFNATGQTLNMSNFEGVTTLNSNDSTQTLTLTAIQENTALGCANSSQAAGTDILNATYVAAVTNSGSDETFTLGMNGGNTGGDVTVGVGGATGFEKALFTSSGDTKNVLSEYVDASASLVALDISGTQDFDCELIPDAILTIDASGMSGDLVLGDGIRATGADGYDTFATGGAVAYTNITGGSGDDTFIFENSLLTTDFDGTGEELDGGDGTDILQASIDTSIGTSIATPNIEEIWTNAGAAVSWKLDAPQLVTLTIDEDAASHAYEIKGIVGTPDLNFRGNGIAAAANKSFDAITYTSTGVNGTNDALNITIGNRGVAVNTTTATTWVQNLGALAVKKIENFTLTVSDGHATIGGIDSTGAGGNQTWTIVASHNLTLGVVNADATEQMAVDATGVLGDFSATFSDMGDNGTIDLGPGDDTVLTTGSTGADVVITGGAGDDAITGAALDDEIDGGAGDDTIDGAGAVAGETMTGGTGDDIYLFTVNNAAAVDVYNISDFEQGANGDILKFDVSAVAGGIVAALDTTNFSNGTDAATGAADNTVIVINDATYADFATAELVVNGDNAATDDYILVFRLTGTGLAQVYADADSAVAGAGILLAVLENIDTDAEMAALVAGNFAHY